MKSREKFVNDVETSCFSSIDFLIRGKNIGQKEIWITVG